MMASTAVGDPACRRDDVHLRHRVGLPLVDERIVGVGGNCLILTPTDGPGGTGGHHSAPGTYDTDRTLHAEKDGMGDVEWHVQKLLGGPSDEELPVLRKGDNTDLMRISRVAYAEFRDGAPVLAAKGGVLPEERATAPVGPVIVLKDGRALYPVAMPLEKHPLEDQVLWTLGAYCEPQQRQEWIERQSCDGAEVMKWPKRMLPSRPHPYSLTEVVFEDYGNLFFVGGMADDWVTGS